MASLDAADEEEMPREATKAAILLKRETCAIDCGAKLSYETLVVEVMMVDVTKAHSCDAKDLLVLKVVGFSTDCEKVSLTVAKCRGVVRQNEGRRLD